MKRVFTVILFSSLLFCLTAVAQDETIQVSKIWDRAEHNAFTDLIRFKGSFYCSFREGNGHVPGENGRDGTARILRSADGEKWESVALLKKAGIDLRDPKLSIMPDGRLMVIMGGSFYDGTQLLKMAPQVSFSDPSGQHFSAPEKVAIDPGIVSEGDWIWRVTWHKGTGYAIDYQSGPTARQPAFYLLKTTDGRNFEKVSALELDGSPNEATVGFGRKDTMHVLIRRESGDKKAVFARSAAPYTDWEFRKTGFQLGGPDFLFDKKGKMIAGGRLYDPEVRTAVLAEDDNGNLQPVVELPSAGDNSYPGMLVHKKILYVSYYSSHQGKTSIYFARIPLRHITDRLRSIKLER